MEDLPSFLAALPAGSVVRPKSLCLPERHKKQQQQQQQSPQEQQVRRNPLNRATSRLYRIESPVVGGCCVGPEFVVRASLPSRQVSLHSGANNSKTTLVVVILLDGQKLNVTCNPGTTTAGQLFETIVQKEHIEENFMLGLSALVAGDFVFLPSDTKISKIISVSGMSIQSMTQSNNATQPIALRLFMRVRFFLPSLRGIRGPQARHLLYLQLRRSILEHQLPCSLAQLIELDGLALQAEFGNFSDREHGSRDYFLLEHYVPETMYCSAGNQNALRSELKQCHQSKKGLDPAKAEQDFITLAQTLPHYGGHFYTATWTLKENAEQRPIWLYISARGINLYERGSGRSSNCGPKLYEMFEWRNIQTLCYSKHYLCILPHSNALRGSKLKKYKLKMDHKKSYFTFRLASLHHQFFLRLRTEYTSLQTIAQQFGIPLKDIKNETNSLCKLGTLTNAESEEHNAQDNIYHTIDESKLDGGAINAGREFQYASDYRKPSPTSTITTTTNSWQPARSRSVSEFMHEISENEQNEERPLNGLAKPYTPRCTNRKHSNMRSDDRRLSRGVKMGTRAFQKSNRVSRSMETVILPSSTDIGSSQQSLASTAYVLDGTISKSSCPDVQMMDQLLQESMSETLQEKLNTISFVGERVLCKVSLKRDQLGNVGMQVTEGSDGHVYVKSVIANGAAHASGMVSCGDQVVAVNGECLLELKYEQALEILKNAKIYMDLVLAKSSSQRHTGIQLLSNNNVQFDVNGEDASRRNDRLDHTMRKLQHLTGPRSFDDHLEQTQGLHSITNSGDLSLHRTPLNITNQRIAGTSMSHVPYHKHIRYEVEPETENVMLKKQLLQKSPLAELDYKRVPLTPIANDRSIAADLTHNTNLSRSCTQIANDCGIKDNDAHAVVVGMIPKSLPYLEKFASLSALDVKSRPKLTEYDEDIVCMKNTIALPRSLGLSRKWRGPVKYPVTPLKKIDYALSSDLSGNWTNASDDEQVFI